ncbi:aminoacyl-tRNA hydrolase [Thioclava sp. SK-1]|uniref:aminoacyl-tRNA hydrolase n=1 Tax=Thioclava sp. SK-1 TaxID=1889770 RepID=UPI0008243ED8|nr:aminoacyl-tRNA hydrolase [Thioclava sp. SK-1]OCX60941.1 aminoacyl-tRNA hydrolase [Thioclava sp. SK-1]
MQLWVGLGNPGAKYAGNRHNIGFMALDQIAVDHGFAPFRSKFHGQLSEGRLGSQRIALLKPDTFMNLSGQAVRAAVDFYKLTPDAITVFHDELDLAPGKCRVKQGGGHAGHNGLRSIHGHIGPEYQRVRLGIGHPGHKDRVAAYVLGDFAKAEATMLDDLMRGLSDGAPALAAGDSAKFLNAVSLRVAPPRSSTGTRPQGKPVPQAAAPSDAPMGKATPAAKADAVPQADARSPLQRLADKFSK